MRGVKSDWLLCVVCRGVFLSSGFCGIFLFPLGSSPWHFFYCLAKKCGKKKKNSTAKSERQTISHKRQPITLHPSRAYPLAPQRPHLLSVMSTVVAYLSPLSRLGMNERTLSTHQTSLGSGGNFWILQESRC